MEVSAFASGKAPREMRRREYLLSPEDTEQYLREENWGVLAVHGDNGFPYGVPMNYVWDQGSILLHAASENSHRFDALSRDSKVCFTVVPEHRLDRENWSTSYTSILVFGTAEIITAPEKKLAAMQAFMNMLAPGKREEAFRSCPPEKAKMVMIRIHPIMITGKQNT